MNKMALHKNDTGLFIDDILGIRLVNFIGRGDPAVAAGFKVELQLCPSYDGPAFPLQSQNPLGFRLRRACRG